VTERTVLVTDSTCNLPADLTAHRRIHVAPLYILWGDDVYKDGVDITEAEFYQRLVGADDFPKTSQVAPQDFVSLFQHAREAEEAEQVVCAVISSELSGTYASAIQARDMVDFPVHVIDTRQTSWALGHAMLAGAEARDEGASAAEIAAVIADSAARQQLIFTIKSLEYLHRGGRIGHARLLLGSALQIQPLLQLCDGIVESAENVRTRKRAVEHLLRLAETFLNGEPLLRFSVLHGGAADEAETLLARGVQRFSPRESYVSYVTPVLGVHTGPEAIGVVVERAG
jgi:DegV family protein with EDD domain